MSTASTLKLALTGARQAYDAYADFRDRRVSNTYDALSTAAENYGPRADDAVDTARGIYDDSVKKAGHVTKAARTRLEKAIATAEEKGNGAMKDARSSGKKMSRKARRKASKAERKLNRKKESNHWVRNLSLAALTASGVAAIAYAVINKRKDTPGTTPPRVEEQIAPVEEEAPVLVYSTETGEPAAEVPEDIEVPETVEELEAELAEEAAADNVAEDTVTAEGEELSEAEAIQAEFDAKNAPQRDQSDK